MARALYIHWPFCLAKCPYCDFNSHVRSSVDEDLWERALLADLRFEAECAGNEPLESVFFGGGTPSLMPPRIVARLLEEAERLWGFSPRIEITLEANPSSVEAANFAALAVAGVNRVSLGLQALHDEQLRFLGRLHDVAEGLNAVETAQNAFARINIDLIYALAGQHIKAWQRDLHHAIEFGTDHMALYQLTIEPGTRFATMVRTGEFAPMNDDEAADFYTLTAETMIDAGLPWYETSNYSRPGQESRHNLTYWRYHDYVGIGPGAHGRRGGFATTRHRKPENWLAAVQRNGSGLQEERALGANEQASEALLMGLRLREGIDPAELAGRFGMAADNMLDMREVDRLLASEHLKREGERLRVTVDGMLVLNALLPRLVSDALIEA